MTLLTLSYKKSKMRAILGTIVYILTHPIGRRAIKKIESVKSVKSVMSFFYVKTPSKPAQISSTESPIVSDKLVIRWIFVRYCPNYYLSISEGLSPKAY